MADTIETSRARWGWGGGVLLVGVVATVGVGAGRWGNVVGLVALIVAVGAGLVIGLTSASGGVIRLLDRLAQPSRRARMLMALGLAIGGGAYLLETAVEQGRGFGPTIHDEYANIIATRMLAQGKLWMPRHPAADFFDSYHLITDRVYASKYGPGTAMFCVPAAWVGAHLWFAPLILASVSIGLFYLVLCEMFDGVAALLGALMLPAMSSFRRVSIEVLSEAPMLFLALVLVWAFLQWRKTGKVGWAVVMGVCVGWGGLTRPVDALCLAGVVGVGVLMGRRGPQAGRLNVGTALAGLGAVAPFLGVQLVCNWGITGDWLKLPWTHYSQRSDPYDRLGGGAYDPARRTQSVVPVMQWFEREVTVQEYQKKLTTPMVKRVWEHSLRPTLQESLPHPLLMLPAALGVIGLRRNGRWIWPVAAGLFVLIYSRHTFFLNHYAVVMAPGVIILVLAGWEVVGGMFRSLKRALRVALGVRIVGVLATLALTLTAMPQMRLDRPSDEWDFAPIMRFVDFRMDEVSREPALVLFTSERPNPHMEPVYNMETAWPDEARVVRAHDLGARNRELFAYYAERAAEGKEAERSVYLFTLAPEKVEEPPRYLGKVGELSRR